MSRDSMIGLVFTFILFGVIPTAIALKNGYIKEAIYYLIAVSLIHMWVYAMEQAKTTAYGPYF